MAAEHASALNRRLEAAQEPEPVVTELRSRPPCRLQHALVRLLVAELERDEKVVGVAVDAGAAELLQQLDALTRLRSSLRDVTECDDQVGLAALLQVGKCGTEGNGIAVHVGEEGDAHTGTL